MGVLGNDILSFIITALICGILSSLVPSSKKNWMKILCGLVLVITLINPFMALESAEFNLIDPSIKEDADFFISRGEKTSYNAMADIITQNTGTYIMDKAAELGIHVQVEISVNDEAIPVPVRADLYGEVSPYAKLQLESLIQKDLGIPKENIRWMQ